MGCMDVVGAMLMCVLVGLGMLHIVHVHRWGVCMVHLGLCVLVGAHMDKFSQVYMCAWAAPCGNRE